MRPGLALIVIACVVPGSTEAQVAPNEERARGHYAAGREHYENGRYEQAIGDFEAAVALSPRPELRYNLYLAYERLGQFERALVNLDSYLAEGAIEPAERERLVARREALRLRAAPPAAAAHTPPEAVYGAPPAPDRRRQGAFFARFGLGIGYASAETDAYKVSGGIGGLQLAAGFRVLDPLALHATIWGASMVGADVESKVLNITIHDENVRYTSAAIGLGLTYSFPARFFASGSIGAASVSAERDGDKVESDVGPALNLTAGKDWLLGRAWALGVAASFSFQAIPETIRDVSGAEQDNPSSVVMIGALATLAYD
jgi:hypothetical protein